eukprot:gb/GEZJ01002958.1/.p1 GENE.gb/GEZJ01002958.1/~~gb/GEZJ01002958.1/.p1  ORF type:complete len:345 (-),score=30.49 gb/GEZJ01002958.1/:518-1552(-)
MKIVTSNMLLMLAVVFSTVQARAFWRATYSDELGNTLGSMFSLRPSTRLVESKMSTIKFSAYGTATLYINGKQYKEVTSISPIVVQLPLRKNDLVAFKAEKTGSKAGLMATISWGSKTYITGRDRFTARGDYGKWEVGEQRGWNSAVTYTPKTKGTTRTFCHWDRADKSGIETRKFDNRASFIWRLKSENNDPVDTAYFRLVVGGENCGVDPKKTGGDDTGEKGDKNKNDDSVASHRVPELKNVPNNAGSAYSVSGQNDGVSSEGFCACRYTESRGGGCFDMEDPSASSGKCRPRSCEPKFECVASGEKICVKRRGGLKVVLVAPNQCITVFADDTESLIPYEG